MRPFDVPNSAPSKPGFRTAAGVLGHASPMVTLSTYALHARAQREAVDRRGERLTAAGFDAARMVAPTGIESVQSRLRILAEDPKSQGNKYFC